MPGLPASTTAASLRRAIVIFPPSADLVRVEAVRRRFDPLSDSVPAHVTLVFPFDTEISESDLLRHVEVATTGVGRFAIEFNGLSCTDDHVLFLLVSAGSDPITKLHDRLYSGPLEPYRSDRVFVPHMTIGRFNSPAACTAALRSQDVEHMSVRTEATAVSVYRISARGDRSIESEVVLR